MTDDRPLDPDELPCPRCHVPPGEVCRRPNGTKAPRIHAARKAIAAVEKIEPDRPGVEPTDPAPRARKAAPPATAESRRKGGKAAQERSAARRAELVARREEAERAAIKAQADELARRAADYDLRRMALRAKVFDVAAKVWTKAEEVVDGLQTIQLDENGRPKRVAVEVDKPDGGVEHRVVLDVRGAYSARDVRQVVMAAATALDKLRLEEGQPTGITENRGAGFEHELGDLTTLPDAELAELLDRMRRATGGKPPPSS